MRSSAGSRSMGSYFRKPSKKHCERLACGGGFSLAHRPSHPLKTGRRMRVIQSISSSRFRSTAGLAANSRTALSGAEVRFIRKFLELTQARLADLLGVEEQSVRRWEGLEELPKQADRSVRLVFRDTLHDLDLPLAELIRRIAEARLGRTFSVTRWPAQAGKDS